MSTTGTARGAPARTRLWKRVLFSVVTLVLALSALELGARAALWLGIRATLPPDVVQWIDNENLVFDPVLGWHPSTGVPKVVGAEYTPDIFDRDQSAAEPGTIFGYTFGDSQTRGAGVAETESYPTQLEGQLRRRGWRVRVTNLAASGFRSAQVLELIEAYASHQQAAFFLVDCRLNDSGTVTRDYHPEWMWARRLLFDSRAYRLLRLAVARAQGQDTGPGATVTVRQTLTGSAVDGPNPGGNHQAIAELARALDVPLLFVDYPFWGTPIRSLAPAAALPEGVPVVPATAALNADGRPVAELFLENNHLTIAGHAVVATAAAESLEPILRERHPEAHVDEPLPLLPQAGLTPFPLSKPPPPRPPPSASDQGAVVP